MNSFIVEAVGSLLGKDTSKGKNLAGDHDQFYWSNARQLAENRKLGVEIDGTAINIFRAQTAKHFGQTEEEMKKIIDEIASVNDQKREGLLNKYRKRFGLQGEGLENVVTAWHGV